MYYTFVVAWRSAELGVERGWWVYYQAARVRGGETVEWEWTDGPFACREEARRAAVDLRFATCRQHPDCCESLRLGLICLLSRSQWLPTMLSRCRERRIRMTAESMWGDVSIPIPIRSEVQELADLERKKK